MFISILSTKILICSLCPSYFTTSESLTGFYPQLWGREVLSVFQKLVICMQAHELWKLYLNFLYMLVTQIDLAMVSAVKRDCVLSIQTQFKKTIAVENIIKINFQIVINSKQWSCRAAKLICIKARELRILLFSVTFTCTSQNYLLRFTVLISFLHIVSCKISMLICRTKPKFILNQFDVCEAPHLIFIEPRSSMQRFADTTYFSRVSLRHNP